MTILGSHTLSELRDLLNAYNYQFDELSKAYDGAKSHWLSVDSAGATQWKSDFDVWAAATWGPAKAQADTVLNGTATSLQGITTDEETYLTLAAAFAPMADLDRRFRASQVGNAAPSYAQTPQPTAADADLGAFKATDAGVAAMPAVVKSFIGNVAPGLAPQNKDAAAYAPMPMWKKVALGVGAFLGLAVFVKIAK